METYTKIELESIYKNMMNAKHSLREMGASWETIEEIEDKLHELGKIIESKTEGEWVTKTDSMFS